MSNEIYQTFKSKLPITINKSILENLIKIVRMFEIRGDHPMTLNSPLIGCYDFKFTYNDRELLFTTFNQDEDTVRDVIKNIKNIPKEFKVVSDPFNMFCIWIMYNIVNSKNINNKLKEDALVNLCNYFQYKIFGSTIYKFFTHGAQEDYMTAVIEDLNMKFDIKREKTWKNIIVKRTSTTFLEKGSMHYNVIHKFAPDKEILLVIADIRTRIGNQIRMIANLYYEYYEQKKRIESTSSSVEIDGEKIIKEPEVTYEAMNYVIINHIKHGSVNQKYLTLINGLYKSVSKSLVSRILNVIHNVYLEQIKNNYTKKIIISKDPKKTQYTELYIGLDILVKKLIYFSFTYLMKNNIDINNRYKVIINLYKAFSSSRTLDETFINLKYTLRKFILDNKITRRESTISSLIPSIELYLILIGLDVLKK